MSEFDRLFGEIYNAFEGSDLAHASAERHGVQLQAVLTVTNDEHADNIVALLEPRIAGKIVVEIGGGIGLLACHLGAVAERVYCFEANPMWSWVFATLLMKEKPKNVSFIFGAADEFVGLIKADVAIFCTHSGIASMKLVGAQFAPVVIDVYGEMIREFPDSFDAMASSLREIA